MSDTIDYYINFSYNGRAWTGKCDEWPELDLYSSKLDKGEAAAIQSLEKRYSKRDIIRFSRAGSGNNYVSIIRCTLN